MAYEDKEQKSGKKHQDIIDAGIERYQIASDSDQTERNLALDDLQFENNEDNYQWPADIKQQREQDLPQRPCLSINKLPEKIDKVEGEFRQLKPSFKIRGVDSISDPKIADIMSGIIRHIEYNSNARSAYNHSYSSTLKCGRGAWRVGIEDSLDDPFVKDIVIDRIADVLTVFIDPDAQKQDRSDANWEFVVSEMSTKQFEKKYPDTSLQNWPDNGENVNGWRTESMIRVAEYWWKEPENRTFYRVERSVNGIPTLMTLKEDKKLDTDVVKEEKTIKIPVVRWCKMIYNQVIEGPHEWPSRYIPIIFEVGKETNIQGHNKTKGMVRNAKTPQQMYNYWVSSSTEQVALAPKAPYLATPKMLARHQAQWDSASVKNYMYLLYDPDSSVPGLRPVREVPPQLSTAMSNELSRMEHDIMSSMGIYESSLGAQGPEVSGRAILAKQKMGSVGTYTYTDNFQTALIYSMKVIIDLIPYVYDTERIIRIRGEDGVERSVPINARPAAPIMQEEFSPELISDPRNGVTEYINDMTVGKYDIVVSIGPSYDTQRQEALNTLMELVGVIPQFGPATVDLIVENIDIPKVSTELIKRAKKIVPVDIRGLEPGEESPPPPPPDPALLLAQKKLELEGLQEMREREEAQSKAINDRIDSIAKLITAEAKERGNQLNEISAFVQAHEERQKVLSEQQATPQPTQPTQPQGLVD